MQALRVSAYRLRAPEAHLWMLIGEHDHRVAEPELGVPDPAVRRRHAHLLRRAQHLRVERDRSRRILADEIRREHRIVLRDRSYLPRHGVPPPDGRSGSTPGPRAATLSRQPSQSPEDTPRPPGRRVFRGTGEIARRSSEKCGVASNERDPAVIEDDVTLGCPYRAAALHRDFRAASASTR